MMTGVVMCLDVLEELEGGELVVWDVGYGVRVV